MTAKLQQKGLPAAAYFPERKTSPDKANDAVADDRRTTDFVELFEWIIFIE
jgi:hypothetical protein